MVEKFDKNKVFLGLYRDDGFVIYIGIYKEVEVCKKDICKVFKDNDFNIIVDVNLKVVYFLDVIFNFNISKYEFYLKIGNIIIYINVKSNYFLVVIKVVFRGINIRLS